MKWTPFPPHLLHIEISEDAPLEQTVEIQATLGELRRLGVRLVCDDFGKNYSNLDRLFLFPDFDIYKLDMVLTRQLVGPNERARRAVLLHIEALAVMGKEICAEGVEHVEQYLRLKKAGCQMAQGYLFTNERHQSGGKMSTQHFKEMIRNNGVLNWVNELSDFHVLDDTRADSKTG
jgi:EAL domain-containing protein (putative c-di-GMP-specific phosphodiesterase class I)